MTKHDFITQKVAEFDKRFGQDGPEKDSDSIGGRAGCDDCSSNIEIRANHKSFFTSSLQQALEVGQNNCTRWHAQMETPQGLIDPYSACQNALRERLVVAVDKMRKIERYSLATSLQIDEKNINYNLALDDVIAVLQTSVEEHENRNV